MYAFAYLYLYCAYLHMYVYVNSVLYLLSYFIMYDDDDVILYALKNIALRAIKRHQKNVQVLEEIHPKEEMRILNYYSIFMLIKILEKINFLNLVNLIKNKIKTFIKISHLQLYAIINFLGEWKAWPYPFISKFLFSKYLRKTYVRHNTQASKFSQVNLIK